MFLELGIFQMEEGILFTALGALLRHRIYASTSILVSKVRLTELISIA